MSKTSSGSAVIAKASDTQIHVTREFAAPRELVWRAMTEPELIRRWWSAKRAEITVCEHDVRPGGRWRNVAVSHDGSMEVAFHGEYKEIVPPKRLVTTEVFEGLGEAAEAMASLNTVTLEDLGGRTRMTVVIENSSEGIDGMLASGMEAGMQDAYDLLEEIAIALA